MAREFVMGARINLNTSGYSSGMAQAIRDTQIFGHSIDTGSSNLRSFDSSVHRTGSSMSQMARQVRTATNEIHEQSRAAGTLRNSLSGLKGVIAAVAGSMAVKGAYNWMVGANADMEQYKNTLTVVMGSQQKAVEQLAWAQKFAAKTPFEIPSIVDATTRLESYGIESKKVLGITGDMASVMGKDLMQAVEAVADAQTGELERMKEFGITKKMIEDQAKMLGTSPINNKGQITDMKAFNTAMFSLMEERFKGGMEMQSKSFKGMLSNAADFMGSMGRRLGQPLFEKAKVGLGDFIGFLSRLQDSGAIDSFITKTQKVGSAIWNAFSTAGSMIVGLFNAIKGPASATIGYLADNFKTLGPYIFGVGSALLVYAGYLKMVALQTKIVTIATRVWNAVTKMSPIWLVAAAIGLLVGYLINLAGGWGVVKQQLIAFLPVLQQLWSSIVAGVMSVLKQLWSVALTVFSNFKTMILPIVLDVINTIVSVFASLVGWVRTHWTTISVVIQIAWAVISAYISAGINTAKIIITGGFQYISEIISGVWNVIKGVIQIGWSIISGLFKTGVALLQGDWKGAWDNMLGMLKGVWSGVKDFFSGLKDLFFDSGKAIMKTLVDGIKSMASAPFDAIKGALSKARELLPFSDAKTGPFSQLTHNGGKIMSTLAEGVYKQAGALHRSMSQAFAGAPALAAGYGFVDSGGYSVGAGSVNQMKNFPVTSAKTTNNSSSKTVSFGDTHVHIDGSGIKNIEELGDVIVEVLHDRLSAADEIYSSADMGRLLD
ncbi:hypothetical protein [Bacillus sp. JJ1764]|uniref:hypothetical protein n=1 Tax=Bacillus sp. JJ1764 TaxID=3122964 RepID=UPI003000A760